MPKLALVTGGSRGIGFGIAQRLAAEQWDLVINGVRDESAVADALAQLRADGVAVHYARGNIGSSAGRSAILDSVRGFAGANSINLLVNNAGVAPKIRADLLEMSEESYDHVIDTNSRGAFFLTQAVAREMIAAKKVRPGFTACIINITSVSASVAFCSQSLAPLASTAR